MTRNYRLITVVALICISVNACSGSRKAAIATVTAPPSHVLVMPRASTPPIDAHSLTLVANGRLWSHLRSGGVHPVDIYLHDSRAYALQPTLLRYVKGERAPYLMELRPDVAREAQKLSAYYGATGAGAAPASGIMAVKPGDTSRFDLTFRFHGRVEMLSDFRGPRFVDFFESDCVGCTGERSQLARLYSSARKAHGILVIVTNGNLRQASRDVAVVDRHIPVVHDNHYSIYAAFNVHRLPWLILESSNGSIIESYIGMLQSGDVAGFLKDATANHIVSTY
jgi:hypothetical protein